MVSWDDLRREPYRILFPLAVIFGCFGVGHWLVYALGWRASYSGFYHAWLQVGAYMSCFIFGFLLTALPRFASAPPASSAELGIALGLLGVHAVGLWLRHWIVAELAFAGQMIFLVFFAGRRFAERSRSVGPPPEFVWIGIAVVHGLLGSLLLILAQAGVLPAALIGVAKPMVQQGFVLGIVLGVAGFMAPRLMGRHTLLVRPQGVSDHHTQVIRARRTLMHLAAGALFFASFWLEGFGWVSQAYMLRAAVATAELLWTTQFLRPPNLKVLYLMLLWISLWLLVCGLWGAALVPGRRVVMLHLVFLGSLSLMTFAIATMVTFSHAGQAERLQRANWPLAVVALGILAALVSRFIAEWHPEQFFRWLGFASIFWLAAAATWLAYLLPCMLRPPAPGSFEGVHEEAKQRLLHGHDADHGRCRRAAVS